jgi:DNA polymerase-3 subunit delta
MARAGTSRKSDRTDLDASMRIVILRGPEQYLHSAHTRQLVDVLTEAYGEIDRFEFDGATAEPADVLDELRSYGLLAQHKLVVLDNADEFLASPKDEEAPSRGRTSRELMERYAADPADGATLLMRARTWRPGKLDKAVWKVGTIIKCETPGEASAINFCLRRCSKEHGCDLERDAAVMLVDRIGTDLARLDVELAKLAAYMGEDGSIGPKAVSEIVGLSREEKAWELQSALMTGSAGAAVEKVRELRSTSNQPEELLFWSMADLLRKLHAAARLLEQGRPANSVSKELRLWGEAGNAVLAAARRLGPEPIARLYNDVVQADADRKTGLGHPLRTLEALAVRIADEMGSR